MKYDFDIVVDRKGTNSEKWDAVDDIFGGKGLLPLWVADMDFKSPPAVIDALTQRAQHGIYGYTGIPDSALESVATWLEMRHDWKAKGEWVTFTTGVTTALRLAILAFTQPGDKVVIQSPVYGPFFRVVQDTGRQLVNNRLRFVDGRYLMDLDHLESQLDSGVRMMILCSPHNPVGRVWQADELARLGEICLKRGLILVSDEVHADFVYRGHRHIPIAGMSDDLREITVTTVSPSKTFNLAGLATAAVVIPNDKLRESFRRVSRKCGIHTNLFGILALEAAYRHGADWLNQLIHYLQGNLEYTERFIADRMPGVRVVHPEGTYLVWLDFRDLPITDYDLNRYLVDRAGVALNNGADFGPGGEGFQRLNIACPRTTLAEGLDRIARALNGGKR